MSDKIRLLPDSVANQIAAGEVVGRPASVVKEMMENAVDAGARHVSVSIRDGGKESIRIVDDGCGMSPIDARLAFDRHATSKIACVEDIYALHTFGFRGEALASIAAVAQVTLTTRQADDELGTQVCIEGGRFVGEEAVVCAAGSQFSVTNLFYNVPARRRFLDKSTTEARHIAAEFQRVALCHPQVAFTLRSNEVVQYDVAAGSLRGRIAGLMGKPLAASLLEVGTETTIVRLTGYVGQPSACRQNNRHQFLFVNGRYFRSSYFQKAVLQAYDKLIPVGAQPVYFLYLEIDPERIDVNVHPQKTEIKFSDGPAVWQIIHAAVREALARTGAVPMMDFDNEERIEIPVLRPSQEGGPLRMPAASANPSFNPFAYPNAGGESRSGGTDLADAQRYGGYFTPSIRPEGADSSFDPERDGAFGRPESVGSAECTDEDVRQAALPFVPAPAFEGLLRLAGGYAATTFGGRLAVIDLHRAREVMLYERYLLMLLHGSSASQRLLFPQRMALSIDDRSLLVEHLDEFAAFGFETVPIDEVTVEFAAVPADFAAEEIPDLVYDLLDSLRDEVPVTDEMRRRRWAAILARNGARRGTGELSEGEVTAVLDMLSFGAGMAHTPDGRPTVAVVGEEEWKKWFR